MKRLIISLVVLTSLAFGRLYADNFVISETAGVSQEDIWVVSASSSTATPLLSARTARKGYIIGNNDSTYAVYLCTHAATAAKLATYVAHSSTNPANGFRKVAATKEFSDSVECYTGVVYGISAVDAEVELDIVEKY